MKTRLLLLMVLGSGVARAQAQAPVAQPAPTDTRQGVPAPAAPAAPAQPAAAAGPLVIEQAAPPAPGGAPSPVGQVQGSSRPVRQPVLVQPRAIQTVPPALMRMPPPGRYGPPPTVRYRLSPPILHAIEPRRYGNAGAPFALGVGGSLLWRNDHAYRVLSDHKFTGALELFATYDVWSPARGLVVAVGASLRSEARVGNRDYELHNNAVQAEVQARYGVTSWLWPHARVAVGGVLTRFTQHDRDAGVVYEDQNGSAVGTFGAGFTLRTPTRLFETHRGRLASLSLGLLVEGGYTVAKPANLDLTPTKPGEVPRATFAAGQIDRSAPYLRIMAVVRL